MSEPSAGAISRRTFIKTASVSAATLFGVGGVSLATKGETPLRPPGGQNERAFLAQCNRCGRCVSVCHTQAIGVDHLINGLESARTPVMRFSLGTCDFCGDCVNVCPTGSLRPFELSSVKIGEAHIDSTTCLAWSTDSCKVCYEVCPYDAIRLNDLGHPEVISDCCNGCGECEYACPVLALRGYIGGSERAIRVFPKGAEQ